MRPGSDRGFTLVELLVVVAVLALLAVFAVPKAYNAISSSRQTKVAADLKRIHDALEQHYLERGNYPKKLNALVDRGYLKSGFTFKSPITRSFYFYAVDENRDGYEPKAYILGAPGKNTSPKFQLYHGLPLPKGKPSDELALAWKGHEPNYDLWLYTEDDATKLLTGLPDSLAEYRIGCRVGASSPCDVYTN